MRVALGSDHAGLELKNTIKALLDSLKKVAKEPDLEVVQPIMYVIDNQEVWIIPVITPSGEQTLVGLVEARSGTTYIGPTLQNVLGQWRGTTGIHDSGPTTDSGISLKEKIAKIRKLLDEIEAESVAEDKGALPT